MAIFVLLFQECRITQNQLFTGWLLYVFIKQLGTGTTNTTCLDFDSNTDVSDCLSNWKAPVLPAADRETETHPGQATAQSYIAVSDFCELSTESTQELNKYQLLYYYAYC